MVPLLLPVNPQEEDVVHILPMTIGIELYMGIGNFKGNLGKGESKLRTLTTCFIEGRKV